MSTKTDNIAKLESLGVYDKWEANVIRARHHKDVNRLLRKFKRFDDLILSSFVHFNTPEGADFWEGISKK